jgi:hypothetical protein
MAAIADGRLIPDDGWQPFTAEASAGRLVALVPPYARTAWNRDPARRPAFPVPLPSDPFFRLPPGTASLTP